MATKKDPPPPPEIINLGDFPSTEEMLVSPDCNGLRTPMPVQVAIARAMDGRPLKELWRDKNVRAAFGGKKPPDKKPRTVVILAGTRCYKSGTSARGVARAAYTASLEGLVPGDEVIVPCLATETKTAHYVFSHIKALCQSPRLRGTIAGRVLTDSFSVARSSPAVESVEIQTVALSSKGSNLVGCWLGGVVFDEAPRMSSEHDSIRSLKASRRAVADRILPGGQEFLIGTPHAPMGDVYELWQERFGHPDEDVVIIQTTGPMMNPFHWTPEKIEHIKRTDPFVYQTSVLGRFADPPETLIPSDSVEASMCDEFEVEPVKDEHGRLGREYIAAVGAAERGAGWTLSIVGTAGSRDGQRILEQAVSRQWFNVVGSPIESRRVLEEIAKTCKRYGLDYVFINQRFVNSYLESANAVGLGLCGVEVNGDQRIEICDKLRDAVVERRLLLTANRQQRSDLIHVQKKPTVNGIQVQYPSSGDGVSCDFVEPLGLCVTYAPDPPGDDESEGFGRQPPRRRAGERHRASLVL